MNNQLDNSLTRQRGLTMLSWLVVIAFLLFQGIMAMNIVPVYLADSSVKTVFKGLESDASLSDVAGNRLRDVVMKRLKINSVYNVNRDDITIKKAKGGYLISLEYEPRGKLIGNLEFIVNFKHEALVASSASSG